MIPAERMARRRYSEYERKWLRFTSENNPSQKDLITLFVREFNGKQIQQATVSESLSPKWAYLDDMLLSEASREIFRRRCSKTKRNLQLHPATLTNSSQNSRYDVMALAPSENLISPSPGSMIIVQPVPLGCTSKAQLNTVQSGQTAYPLDKSIQSFQSRPGFMNPKQFRTMFRSDYGDLEYASLFTYNIDENMADLFRGLDDPDGFELVKFLGETVALQPLRSPLKALISLARYMFQFKTLVV